jgi:hypothetical protein
MSQPIDIFKLNTNLLSIDSIIENKNNKTSKSGKVKYNNQPLKISLPMLMTKYGISKFTDQKMVDSYSLNIELNNNVYNKFVEIEQKLIDLSFKHSEALIGVKLDEEDKNLIERKYKTCIKYSQHDLQKEQPMLRPKVYCKSEPNKPLNFWPLEIYEKQPNVVKPVLVFPTAENTTDPCRVLNKNTEVSCIIDASTIWGSSLGCGNTLKVVQIGYIQSQAIKNECLIVFDAEDFNI